MGSEAEQTEEPAGEHSDVENGAVDGTRGRTHARTPSKESKNNSTTLSKSADLDLLPGIEPSSKLRNSRSGIDPEIRRWFEVEFWPIYPRHEAKSATLQAAAKKATTIEKRTFYLESLNSQLPEYQRRKAESGQRMIPLGTTWFNQDRAEDELSVPELSTRNGRTGPAMPVPDYPNAADYCQRLENE